MGALMGVAGVDPAELEHHPMRHLLTSVIGRKPELEIEVDELDLGDGETLLLSTDGMHGVMGPDLISVILSEDGDLDQKAERIMKTALASDSKDNITVVLAKYSADGSIA